MPLRRSGRFLQDGYPTSDAQTADERLDQVRELTRPLHPDLVTALEADAASGRETSRQLRYRFGGK